MDVLSFHTVIQLFLLLSFFPAYCSCIDVAATTTTLKAVLHAVARSHSFSALSVAVVAVSVLATVPIVQLAPLCVVVRACIQCVHALFCL